MRLREVRLRPFRIPLRSGLRWGKGKVLAALDHVLVEVHLDDGSVGRAEAALRPTIYGETHESLRGAVRWLEPLLRERDLSDPAVVRRVLDRLPCNHAAKAALETALWEARSRSRGVGLDELLPLARDRVRVSFIVGQGEVEDVLRAAEFAYARGVRVFKLKTGGGGSDEARILALRRAFPDAEVYVDANETLQPCHAKKVLERWRELGVTMVEEPLPIELVRDRQKLRDAGVLPLIADDSVFTMRDLWRELELDTFDIANVKPARTGICWSLGQLERVRVQGREAMIGSQAMSSYGAARAALLAFHAAVSRPSELAFHLLAEGGFAEFPPIKDGWLYRDDLRAVAFDPKAFRRYEV